MLTHTHVFIFVCAITAVAVSKWPIQDASTRISLGANSERRNAQVTLVTLHHRVANCCLQSFPECAPGVLIIQSRTQRKMQRKRRRLARGSTSHASHSHTSRNGIGVVRVKNTKVKEMTETFHDTGVHTPNSSKSKQACDQRTEHHPSLLNASLSCSTATVAISHVAWPLRSARQGDRTRIRKCKLPHQVPDEAGHLPAAPSRFHRPSPSVGLLCCGRCRDVPRLPRIMARERDGMSGTSAVLS